MPLAPYRKPGLKQRQKTTPAGEPPGVETGRNPKPYSGFGSDVLYGLVRCIRTRYQTRWSGSFSKTPCFKVMLIQRDRGIEEENSECRMQNEETESTRRHDDTKGIRTQPPRREERQGKRTHHEGTETQRGWARMCREYCYLTTQSFREVAFPLLRTTAK